MRERLNEIICSQIRDECIRYCNHPYCDRVEDITDYLLAEGVIVLPCKVGQTVYRIVGANSLTPYIYDWQITEIRIYQDELLCIDDSDNPIFVDEIGKTVFLTKEEAEKALAEREGK